MMKNSELFENAKKAGRQIILIREEQVTRVLSGLAELAEASVDFLLRENKRDLDRMDPSDPKYDRLKLTETRIRDIAADLRNVSAMGSPIGEVLEERKLENGLQLKKVRVALGVIGIIYEARPNVTFDVFSLCLKSGNVCILKGGSDAEYSNKAIISLIHLVLKDNHLPEDLVQLMPASREATSELLGATGYVDMIIPRGSQNLIDFVREHSKVPVIETGAGIVHTFFDESGDLMEGKSIISNAKLRRVSVCNALDCLIIHEKRLADLPVLVRDLAEHAVEIYADEGAMNVLKGNYPSDCLFPAKTEHFGTEFLSKKMSVKSVPSLSDALDHIAKYSSRHSEAIISENEDSILRFFNEVDAAVVYSNTSTAFTDGAQFGMGAEIGISTQKLHARGPMALRELTSYKWIVRGKGHIRNP
ncbi:MAG: glutamate-5-semialdehyde dehydrogenase [Cyclobacteriaceae bacterium]|nr:glutamate-5-semialdehyde dehydrogenase [Cyclobacteriaceae bacterium]